MGLRINSMWEEHDQTITGLTIIHTNDWAKNTYFTEYILHTRRRYVILHDEGSDDGPTDLYPARKSRYKWCTASLKLMS